MTRLVALLLLVGCASEGEPLPSRITPADGQTAVSLEGVLRVRTGGELRFPERADVPEAIRVIDLESGGFVPGAVDIEDDMLVFVPDEPWSVDTDFLWTVRPPLDEARAPELEIPPLLQGNLRFSTRDEIRPLAAAWNGDGELCVLFSQPPRPDEIDRIAVGIGGDEVPVFSRRFLLPAEIAQVDLDQGDRGIGGACFGVPGSGAAQARLSIDGRDTLLDLFVVEPLELVIALRRGS